MKKALKVIAIILGSLFIVAGIALVIFLKNLPSSWQVKQAISPRSAQQDRLLPTPTPHLMEEGDGVETSSKEQTELPRTDADRMEEGKELSQKVLHEDFLNEKQPLSSVCSHLDKASASKFLRQDESASSKEFLTRLSEKEKDPLVESAAPALRYVLRLPRVRGLIEMVDKAEESGAEDLLKKAEFYTQIGLAAKDVSDNKKQLDQMLMKSYNMYILARAVAKHPELSRDPATLGFCDQIERNINMGLAFNADQQAQELQKFLDYAKVPAEEVGYDPHYRSDVKFNVEGKTLALSNIWIERLFTDDIERAGRQFEESGDTLLPPPEGYAEE